jgi:hydroxymethylpyrimidine pyrophosphatase-like HAD family hydrolase
VYVIALATDYDETLAEHGRLSEVTFEALKRFKETGRRLIMVTGRELPDLKSVCPYLDIFDRIVVENGALLYNPSTQVERDLAPPPAPILIEHLQRTGIPLSVGRTILATREPHEQTVLKVIHELGLEAEIIFNKGAVMVLPSGINKASGLLAACEELGISPHNVVAIGDAENDHAFLQAAGCGVAVANALPALKANATFVTNAARGAGVAELMARIGTEDGALMPAGRHGIVVGQADSREIAIASCGRAVLVAGRSGIGKSTLATALTECMCAKHFQFCVFDPEGDYQELEHAVVTGDAKTPPTQDAIFGVLDKPVNNVVVNTLALEMPERPTFFAQLLPRILAMRGRLARPHWLIIDEAHHLLPAGRSDVTTALPGAFTATIFITVHPDAVSPAALQSVDTVIALGDHARDVISRFCKALGMEVPALPPPPAADEVLFWRRGEGAPFAVKVRGPKQAHKRHTRKYAQGELAEEENFYFRGRDNRLNLRAQNTTIFLQIADGLDDETWEFHLRRGDYSAWFRQMIKDPELADEVAAVERDSSLSPPESRARIKEAVNRRYTAPAKAAAE